MRETEYDVEHLVNQAGPGALRSPNWPVWSGFLLCVYIAISLIGWKRTLIDTEIWAVFHASRSFPDLVVAVRDDLVHPPLMYLIEWSWIRAFGNTDTSLKVLALLVNIPSFFLFTRLLSQLTPHWRLGSLLFFNFYFRIGNTPNQLRMYGLGLLLTITAMVLWEKWRRAPHNKFLLGWLLVAVLLVYTHLFGLLILTGFVAANWIKGPRRWTFAAAAAVVALAVMPWYLYALPVYESRGLADNLTWVPRKIHIGLGMLSYGLLGEFSGSIPLRIALAATAGAVNLFFFILVLRTGRSLWPPRTSVAPGTHWFWVATCLLAVPLLLDLLFALAVRPALHWRFVLGILPAYWMLLVLVAERNGRSGRILLYGIVLPWVLTNTAVSFVSGNIVAPARQAAYIIAGHHDSGDLLLAENLSIGNQLYWEWNHRLGRQGRIEVLTPPAAVARLSVLPPTDFEHLDLQGVDRVWFYCITATAAKDARSAMAAYRFRLRKEFPLEHPFLLLFVREELP